MNAQNQSPEPKSSRNPWPIAIIAYFIVFITFIASFITFATRQKVDLVRSDYYDDEIGYQKQIERESHTLSGSSKVTIAYKADTQQIVLRFPGKQDFTNTTGNIHLYRPSDASIDQEMPLAVGVDGMQSLDAKKLKFGLWKVRVQWTVNGEEYYSDQPLVVAAAK